MKVVDFDGNESNWNLAKAGAKDNASGLHIKARDLLKEVYPTVHFIEEVPIKINRFTTLYLDFYIPLYKKAIEVHGEQHYKFTPHFHHTAWGFAASKKRDQDKIKWCELNNLKVVELPYNEDEEQWMNRLLS